MIVPGPSSCERRRRFLEELPAAVEQAHLELLLVAGPQQQLGRHDLHVGRLFVLGDRRLFGRGRPRRRAVLLRLVLEAVQGAGRQQVQPAVRDDGRGPAFVAGERETSPVGLAALEAGDAFLLVGRQDVPAAVLLDVIDLAVGIQRARRS